MAMPEPAFGWHFRANADARKRRKPTFLHPLEAANPRLTATNPQQETAMEQEQMQRCLNVVVASRASGHKAKTWAQTHGVPERLLASWSGHARCWQARLDSVVPAPKFLPGPAASRPLTPRQTLCWPRGAHANALWRHARDPTPTCAWTLRSTATARTRCSMITAGKVCVAA
jgi:hypothetical protein